VFSFNRFWMTRTPRGGDVLVGPTRMGLIPLVGAATAMALTGAWPAAVSTASPSNESEPEQCAFVLTPPTLVRISGVNFAMATVKPGSCTMHASPNLSVVCLSLQGDDSSGQCAHENSADPAVIYYTYRPGATYVLTGQGCANLFVPPYTICQDFGPSRYTL
jgi:hypothetical protein